MDKHKSTFKAIVHECGDCGGEVFSKHSGHFATCDCGNSSVDQTEHYIRVVGKARRTKRSKYFNKKGKEVL